MDEKKLRSRHNLNTNYKISGKVRTIIIGWVIFLTIYVLTRQAFVQDFLLGIGKGVGANTWLEICIYDTGIGFVCGEVEQFYKYEDITLTYGAMQQSFYVTCKEVGLKNNEYGFAEFAEAEVLANNLKRYSNIRP
jgi:hypothetical protein